MEYIVIHTKWTEDGMATHDEIHEFSNEDAARNAAQQMLEELNTYWVRIAKIIT
jgi:hypothetical protein